ncbi:MAG: 2-C-methyl-D-erythritol 2,4-cyclodiphosphate synthase [Actinomycetota bacterium]|nr:2-C-methyl-D-erythritol 2,4-cyclodiphosphate synthase [Actinomycetota bacterium]
MADKIGIGYDSHRLVPGRKFMLGGIDIPFEKGLLGHSDGDALIHAIIDAVLGAAGEGNIGEHFPDTDPAYKNASSMDLLKKTVLHLSERGFSIESVDSAVILEKPKLAPYLPAMKEALSSVIGAPVNIKPKTNEGMGFAGRGEGVAVMAVCLLKNKKNP